MSLHLILLTVVSLTTLFLGLLVYLGDRKNIVNKSFTVLSLVIILWITINYLCDLPSQSTQALFWNKATFALGALMAVMLFYFSLIFPRRFQNFTKFWEILFFSISGILILLILTTPLFVKEIEFYPWGTNIIGGSLFFISVAWGIFCVGGLVVASILKYRISMGIEKTQMKYFFLGLTIFTISGIITNLILPAITGTNELAKYGPYPMVFFISFTAYAITKHHLFDIRVIVTEVIAALIALGLLIDALLSPNFIEGGLKGILFLLVSYGGYRLVLSVREEIRRRQEIQELTDQLKKANIRLQELDRLKSEFLSMASHELNSPMSIILGYLHMILFEGFGKVDKNARQYLEKVYFKSKLLAKLVADLLNVSRIEQGRLKIEIKPTDLQATLKDLCEDYATQAKEKGINFVYHESKPALPNVLVDPDKLKEIITNLLSNAVKFTKQGGVDVWAEKTDSEVKVTVKDTGVGIPKEIQKHIGEKFYRVDNTLVREVGGTGLGLHLVQQYLNLMHGKLWFESEGENKGTTFYFTLPIAKG